MWGVQERVVDGYLGPSLKYVARNPADDEIEKVPANQPFTAVSIRVSKPASSID